VPYTVVMPQLGLTMTEGSVTGWAKRPGEWVNEGEILFTVQTDKVEMEVESLRAGFLQATHVEVGQTVPVGTPIATLVEQLPGQEQYGSAASEPS